MKLVTRRWVFGVIWAVASIIGLCLGGYVAVMLIVERSAHWLFAFATMGAGLGVGQWAALLYCSGFSWLSLWWLPTTIVGVSIGALLGFPLEDISLFGFLTGLSLGIAQWLVLAKWAGLRALLWIVVNTVALSIAVPVLHVGVRSSRDWLPTTTIALVIAVFPSTVLIPSLLPRQRTPPHHTMSER